MQESKWEVTKVVPLIIHGGEAIKCTIQSPKFSNLILDFYKYIFNIYLYFSGSKREADTEFEERD